MTVVPSRLEKILGAAPEISTAVKKTLVDFDSWLAKSSLVFFPEYTDHGPKHISDVLATAEQLATDASLELFTPEDAGALILAVVLHDCGMHLTNDGFRRLVSGKTELVPIPELGDRPWGSLWEEYLGEAIRFSPAQNHRLFGDPAPVQPPPLDDWNWNKKQDLLAGEFLRRHHAQLAHQIARNGFPGAQDEVIHMDSGLSQATCDIIGVIARSHGMALRPCVDYLESAHYNRIDPERIHAIFLMATLRIADYVQIEASRAATVRIRMQAIRSTLSIHEWKKHHAVPQITKDEKDPEALLAIVRADQVDSITTYSSLRRLARDIQRELDDSWAILGEVYGRLTDRDRPLSQVGISIRRLRTNLEARNFLDKLPFRPEAVSFQSADAKLFELLIEPLYGPNVDIGVRELVQNGLDAVRELEAYCRRHGKDPDSLDRPKLKTDVEVAVEVIHGVRCLTVRDRGIGMTMEIVRDYFLKAGASYRNSADWKTEFTDTSQHSLVLRTGYFGVGALAAFLLGDEVNVVTRHVTATEGLGFTASLQTDAIQVNRVSKAPVGTSITIPLRPELAERSWSIHYYFLTKPSVNVQPREPGSATYPDVDDPSTAQWERLQKPERPVVFWRRDGPYVNRIVHNGFLVEHGDQRLRTLYSDRRYGLEILLPPLHILDREGNQAKPYLNLARTEFRQERFEPLESIFLEVLKDYLAFLLVTVPADAGSRIMFGEQQYRYADCVAGNRNLGFERGTPRCLPVVYTSQGLVPLDGAVLQALGVRSLWLARGATISEMLKLDPSSGILLTDGPADKNLLYPSDGIGEPPGYLNVIGTKMYKASSYVDAERSIFGGVKSCGHPQTVKSDKLLALQRGLAEHIEGDEAVQWTLGSPEETPELTAMQTILRAFSHREQKGDGPIVLVWKQLLGNGAIPYDLNARKTQLSKAYGELSAYVAAWEELRPRAPSRVPR